MKTRSIESKAQTIKTLVQGTIKNIYMVIYMPVLNRYFYSFLWDMNVFTVYQHEKICILAKFVIQHAPNGLDIEQRI